MDIAKPKVSVVIPTYNRAAELRRAVQSVALQDYPSLEVVVVDDASNEDISSAFTALRSRPDIVLRCVRNKASLGSQRSRIVGCHAATGQIIALLDNDDWWEPAKISRQAEALAKCPNALISCSSRLLNSGVVVPSRPMREGEHVEDYLYTIVGGFFQSSTYMMAKDTLVRGLEACQKFTLQDDSGLAIYLQRQGHPIVQIAEQLAVFDDRPRDRLSNRIDGLQKSLAWFEANATDWPKRTRAGFMIVDMVYRSLRCGSRWNAAKYLIKGLSFSLPLELQIRAAANVVFNGSPLRFFRKRNMNTNGGGELSRTY